LHKFAAAVGYRSHYNDYIKIGELLLNAMPDMVNTINKKNQTPRDTFECSINNYIFYGCKEDWIALFEKHGAKTAQQLEDEKRCLIKK
jgi:hypothetical protein